MTESTNEEEKKLKQCLYNRNISKASLTFGKASQLCDGAEF